jgi:hypothetical protein
MTISCSSPEKRLSWLREYLALPLPATEPWLLTSHLPGRDRSTCDGLGWSSWWLANRPDHSCVLQFALARTLWHYGRSGAKLIMIEFDCRLWLFTLHVRSVLPSTVRLNYGMAGSIKESTYVIVVSCTLRMLKHWFTSQPLCSIRAHPVIFMHR